MATPLLPPSASSAMSVAAASAARARAVAAKSRDGGAWRNLGLSRPPHLLSADAAPPVCLSFTGWLSRCLLSRASTSRHLLSCSRLTRPDNSDRPSIRCVRSRNHPQSTCGISRRAHRHHRCTRKNCHSNNKYKMELIYYPAPHRERCTADDSNTTVAAIGVVRNERGAASAARARAVAAKSRDGGAQRNLGLSRPRHLLSTGASPPIFLSFAGWLSRRLLSRASASHPLLSRSRLTRPNNGDHPSRRCNCQ
jgi:hypothetical protein